MTRYVLTVQEFRGPLDYGPPIHGQLVDTDVDLADPIGYYRFLKAAKENVGSVIVHIDESGEYVRLVDTVEQ